MAQWVRTLNAKSADLSTISKSQVVEGEDQLQKVVI